MERTSLISSSPHIHSGKSTRSIMAWVLIAMAPAFIWSIASFGIHSLLIVAVSALTCVLTEFGLNTVFKRVNSIGDLSALVTGVLIAFNMPPQVPLYVPVFASIFAIAVVKWSFGGLGGNWMNPALAGRVFVFFSWGRSMTEWTVPKWMETLDSASSATPLGAVKTALNNLPDRVDGPMSLLNELGIPTSYSDLFFGRIPGSLGEISALLVLLGAFLLLILRIVKWQIPLSYIISFAVLIWIFDGSPYGSGLFTGDVLFHLFSGSLMLGAWFMATDMVTTPLNGRGQLIFGIGCGFITFVIRRFGTLPEGVSLAIIFMNILTPLIDRCTAAKRYGV